MEKPMKEITLKEMKRILLAILSEIDSYCEKYNITYYLIYGSLLGAIRHQGYIPWDDDIDIAMKREDYNKFISGFNQDRTDTLRVNSIELDESYVYPFAKVSDTSTLVIEELNQSSEIGVNIDIFPLDELPNEKVALETEKKVKFQYDLLNLKQVPVRKGRELYKNLVLRIGQVILKPLKLKIILGKISELAQQHNGDDKCTIISNFTLMMYPHREIWDASDFSSAIKVPFEGEMRYVPVGYHNVLAKLYHNYMQLPPEEQRITHHLKNVFYKE